MAFVLLACVVQSAWPLQAALRKFAAASIIAIGTFQTSPTSAVTVPLLPGQSNSFVEKSTYEVAGVVSVKEGFSIPSDSSVALYVTAKEDVGAWTSGVRNIRTPPLLTKKLDASKVSFPVRVTLTEEDITVEGKELGQDGFKKLKNALLISARLDVDGNAATRSEKDLVGSGRSDKKDDHYGDFKVVLEGRGVTGKFLTRKQ